jgi:hypothetical protein
MVEAEVLAIVPHGPNNRRMKLANQRPDWARMHYPPSIRFDLVAKRVGWSRGTPMKRPGRRVHLTMTLWVTVLN